jgi:hypothetical protein
LNYFIIGYRFGFHNFKVPQIYTTNETLAHACTHFKIKENMNMNYKTFESGGASPKLLNKQRRIKESF